jgi:hypothetical protein
MNFVDYINGGAFLHTVSKEQVYGTIVWYLNRIFGGNIPLFKFGITLINYLLLNFSIAKYCKHFKFPIDQIVMSIFLICFIPYIFTMSLQLIRQFLAGSIFIYLLVNNCFCHKKNYILIVCMILIHSSSMIFIPFLFLSFWDKPLMKNKIYYFTAFIALIVIQFLAEFLFNSGLFSKIDTLQYALERASQDTIFDLGDLPIWKIIVIVIIALFHWYVGYIHIDKVISNTGLKRYCNTILFLSIFLLLNLQQSELSVRLLFYLFPIIPFMIIWISNQLKISVIFNASFVVGIVLFWVIYLDIGTWKYALPANIWVSPVFLYFL